MSFANSDKAKLIGEYSQKDGDTGSVEVQVALLTERVNSLTEHFRSNPKDKHSKRGMMRVISQRKNLLGYLKGSDYNRYTSLIEKLGLRK